MGPGDLRRWYAGVDIRGTIPFLVISIDGPDVTIMDEGETYPLRMVDVEEFSEPVEDPNEAG